MRLNSSKHWDDPSVLSNPTDPDRLSWVLDPFGVAPDSQDIADIHSVFWNQPSGSFFVDENWTDTTDGTHHVPRASDDVGIGDDPNQAQFPKVTLAGGSAKVHSLGVSRSVTLDLTGGSLEILTGDPDSPGGGIVGYLNGTGGILKIDQALRVWHGNLQGTIIAGDGVLDTTTEVHFGKGMILAVASFRPTYTDAGFTLDANLSYGGNFTGIGGSTIVLNGNKFRLSGPSVLQGNVSGSGQIVNAAHGTMLLDGATFHDPVAQVATADLVNRGTASLGPSGASVALFTNIGTFDAVSDGGLSAVAIHNQGVFEKTAGSGITYVVSTIENSGAVLATSGTLWFDNDFTNGGVATAEGGTLEFHDTLITETGRIGHIGIAQGGTVTFDDLVDNRELVNFADNTGSMYLNAPSLFDGWIAGFGDGDAIHIGQSVASMSYSHNILSLTDSGNNPVAALHFTGQHQTSDFSIAPDAVNGGTWLYHS